MILYFLVRSWQIFERAMEQLHRQLQEASAIREKLALLDQFPPVKAHLDAADSMRAFLDRLTPEEALALKQLMAIGQWDKVIGKIPLAEEVSFRELLHKLIAIDAFYREMGGIIGYHLKVLSLLKNGTSPLPPLSVAVPPFVDISEETAEVIQAIAWGIEELPRMGEIYPLGGAADRLHLVDEKTGEELPAAKLHFAGRTLLEGLIRDLQAREYLYYKTFGEQIETPIAIMTSFEKDNHRHVLQICSDCDWFGRSRESFRFFTQPLVPAVNPEGEWHLTAPGKPLFKPGGHGALWKLARDEGIFSWLKSRGREKALVRQINNPIAGLDYGLIAFTGLGVKKGMKFGFASCPRRVQSAEGINVLLERQKGERKEVVLTNIEYCDFAKFGIEDRPLKEGDLYSRFSSNTNILFADLTAVEKAVAQCPFPGLLVNLKANEAATVARLESTMQNIADVFVEESLPLQKTFITYNHRYKTISTAKKAYLPGRSLQETPENCFYELLQATRELLERHCHISLPERRSLIEYLEQGPDCAFLYHPALGPLYSLIREKMQRGRLAVGAELQLEIADLSLFDLDLDGSLLICAKQVMGEREGAFLRYSEKGGRCTLRQISVRNRGVDWERSHPFWKNQFARRESLQILLRGHSEFIAEDIVFAGAIHFEVEDGMRMRVFKKGKGWAVEKEKINSD